MVGITAYGAYVPRYRLGASTAGWSSGTERSVANFDEDSVTMAVAAGLDCLRGRDRQTVDGLIFATTTPPYAEKQCAAIIAEALDLRRDIFSADVTDVLRAGTNGLKAALDSVAAGSAKQVLVIASDSRQGAPKGDTERNSGDGAAAFLVSHEDTIAHPLRDSTPSPITYWTTGARPRTPSSAPGRTGFPLKRDWSGSWARPCPAISNSKDRPPAM